MDVVAMSSAHPTPYERDRSEVAARMTTALLQSPLGSGFTPDVLKPALEQVIDALSSIVWRQDKIDLLINNASQGAVITAAAQKDGTWLVHLPGQSDKVLAAKIQLKRDGKFAADFSFPRT